ncbi:MAG TPA: methylenetetrahydrofolate--tRNA-(uracil(54)-C(5))-methyltransferase (FADH(2)-oxidizing) TrmFO [Myxococcales bacterium LLY-WYZ-16_1]|jgi:methylenetetrahydrofolate--tRNA-(uracil-5-)-methyltransferase|nr:methylenetetrahydrofolate--tRNA-(uracil(54)-C(5))-methyltransferase (FADH(2)-oxidizing) TrmFO [Myxococcales bacterium LLY-WYZ-16_1]
MSARPVWVVGAGLAGAELSLQLARRGIPVRLFEMKPHRRTPAQVSDGYAELVCSNSFRANSIENAVGAIKEEMRIAGSVLMQIADECAVPAGGALAVDRERFSAEVTRVLEAEPDIEVYNREVTELPSSEEVADVVVATGPLTSPTLSESIRMAAGGAEKLYFYDAIAPIVAADSIDESVVFRASRYGKGEGADYLNCPLDAEDYARFIADLDAAEKVTPRAFEEAKYFEGCLPIEVMAARGPDTLRFGCMKPVGLDDPRTGRRPHAVVQLRAENREGTAYNLVGFQTRLKWSAQKEVFRRIPGLENAEFLRFGSIHRNTYLDAPRLLDRANRLKGVPHVRFAGQITGVEGYVESTASGLLLGLRMAAERLGIEFVEPPAASAMGALHRHVRGEDRLERDPHVPSNVHWGMVPALPGRVPKKERKRRYGERAVEEFGSWWRGLPLTNVCEPDRAAVG